jgi:SAM-dependent methyltransferase
VSRVLYVARAARALLTNPASGLERTLEKRAERHDRRVVVSYTNDARWQQSLHQVIGAGWPCEAGREFDALWPVVLTELADKGLRVGRAAFGGWDDGDAAFARAAWCATRHARPTHVVETGVARGLTTRIVLEALDRNREGHLWSVDLPPLLERRLESERGAAVPRDGRTRWMLVDGSSRRRLPPLLTELGSLDIFIHDSMHTERNLRFELDCAWRALTPGGLLLADDIQRNGGLRSFAEAIASVDPIVAPHEDGSAQFAIVRKPL